MSNQVLVTGGGGFLGKAIVSRLVKKGMRVFSFSRGTYDALDAMGVTQIQGSLTDGEAVHNACKGMDVVYHVAAKAGISGSYESYYDTNVNGTRHILEACRNHGVERLIYTSSPSVIFDGSDMEGVDESVPYPAKYHAPYPETKAMAEQLVIRASRPMSSSQTTRQPCASSLPAISQDQIKRSWPDAIPATPEHENGEGYFYGKRTLPDVVPVTPEHENDTVYFHGKHSWPDAIPATPEHENKICFHGKAYNPAPIVDTTESQNNLKSIILRPHLIWGPEDNHLLPGIVARAKRLKRIGKGDNLVDTIYIDNAAEAHLLADDALKKDPSLSGNVYFISQDDPIALWEMVDALLECAGLPPVKGRVPAKVAESAGWLIETLYQKLGIDTEPPMTRFMAKELATSHWFDISRAKKDLGYLPTVSTREGLIEVKAWLRQKRMMNDE